MRIVHFRTNFDVGLGYDTLTFPLEQLKLGHDVVVVTTDRASASNTGAGTLSPNDTAKLKEPSFEVQGLKVYRLPSYGVRYDDVVLPKGARELLEKIRPDVVQATAAKEMMPAIAAKNKSRLGYSLFTREDQYDFPASSTFRTCIIKAEFLAWRRFWCDYTYNRSDGVLESSVAGLEFLKKYHHIRKEVPLLYTQVCVDLARFYPDAKKRKRIRDKMGVGPADKILISTGKVVPLKRFDVFVRAMAKVPASAKVQAWIIGGGDPAYISSLKDLAGKLGCSDRIKFLPNVAHEDLPDYYNAADIGFWNRSTSSIQEAMSCGLPIIVSRYVATVLPEYNNCQVFDTGDHSALAEDITRLATDSRHAKAVGKRCLETAEKRFDVAAQAKELISLYRDSRRKRC